MGRHAKNNCANPVFTYEERRKITGWGTQKQRLGSDSMLPYENCAVCLHEAQEPLCCPKGHIFCKGCIYENILAQKQHAKEQTKAYEQQLQQAEEDKKLAEEQEHQKRIERFDKSESSVLPATESEINLAKRVQSESQVPAGYVAVKTGTGTLFRKELTAEEIAKYKQLPCYWIPSLAPSNVKEKVQKPTDICLCPVKPHPIKAKQLFPVKFTTTQSKDREKAESKDAKNMCPSCRKSLTNSSKMSILQRCGHVFCRACADTLMKKDKECLVCTKECSLDEIIPLDIGGTGFASAGGALAESRTAPAFQSF